MVVGVLMGMHSGAIWCSITLYATPPIQCIGQDSTSYLKVLAPRWKKDKRGESDGVKGVTGQDWVVRATPPSGPVLQQSVWSFLIRVALPLLLSLVFGD